MIVFGMRLARNDWERAPRNFQRSGNLLYLAWYRLASILEIHWTIHTKCGYFTVDKLYLKEGFRGKTNLKSIQWDATFSCLILKSENEGPGYLGNVFKFTLTGSCARIKSSCILVYGLLTYWVPLSLVRLVHPMF